MTEPDSPDWDTARRPWNRRVDQRPLAVADAEGPDDIAATVAYAARHGVQVTVQASGHGAGGSMENAILLRTSGLREITLDPGQQRVRIGAGVRCSDLLTAGHTDAQFLIELVAVAPGRQADAAAHGDQDTVMAALSPWTTGTTLPSFADPATDPSRLFGPATRQRLADVKRRYDPANVICTSFPVTA